MSAVLISDSTMNTPTPTATASIIVILGMPVSCVASTVRSGSAIVTSTPRIKHRSTGISLCRDFAIDEPMPSPMGIIDMSTPKVNSAMPRMSSSAPNMNSTTGPGSSGTNVIDRISTITVIGSTEENASENFSPSFLFSDKSCISFVFFILCIPAPEAP